MEKLNQDIKSLSEQQSNLRNQRKTIRLVGKRTIDPHVAFDQHFNNRSKLRMLYAISGILKGKSLKEIEPRNRPTKYPLIQYKLYLEKLIEDYGFEKQTIRNN